MYKRNSAITGNVQDIKNLLVEEKNRLKFFTSIADACVDLKINFKEILAVSVKKIAEFTNSLSVICLFADDGKNIDVTSSYHTDDKIRKELWDLQMNYPLFIHEGIPGEVLKTGLPFIAPLVGNKSISSDFLSIEYNNFLKKYSFSDMSVFPIRTNSKTIGTLGIFRIGSNVTYTNDDQTFLQSIANLLASVTRNSRLYDGKEILIRDMHHRLKNNLQVISSLLSIQSDFVKDEESHKLFINSLNRIRAMSLTHENLKRESNFTDIQFDKYVRDLVTFLCRNYNINTNLLKIIIKIPSVSLPIDTSITCGLIINELISNSLKHAFPGGKSGNIKIGLEKLVKQHKLFVSDNGIGLPDKMDIEKDNSFGLLLIRTLVDQLNGKLEVISENGSKFIIRFPNSSF
jgi:two-component sensor histidine kinase